MAADPEAGTNLPAPVRPWLEVGAAVTAVPIAAGTPMSGFAARKDTSIGVHDPLTVRALAIEDACWVTIDVCGLDEETCRRIGDASPLPSDHVIVSATHTHSGPCSMATRLGSAGPALVDALCRAATDTCNEALENRSLCSVSFDAVSGLGIAHNRRHPEVPIDPALQTIAFTRADGAITAYLLQFPCHPVVLGADNLLISADYQGFARRSLEADTPGAVALFLTGAAGDVNTGHSAQSSYLHEGSPKRTFAEAERIGEALGKAARAAKGAPARPALPFAVATARIDLELEILDMVSPTVLADEWAKDTVWAASGKREVFQVWSDWALAQNGSAELVWTGTVSVMRVADILLVALPGEPFLAAAERIQREFTTPVIVAGYSNGCPGYFPTATEFAYGGYEVLDAHRYYGMPAPFKRGSLEKLVETAVSLGRELT